jgi:hypothetical protein
MFKGSHLIPDLDFLKKKNVISNPDFIKILTAQVKENWKI